MQSATPIKEEFVQSQILQAAKQLFRVYGLHKVTVDDVARAVGKGRSSLYYYYKSKEEIFEAVMVMEINEMLEAIGQAVGNVGTVEEKIFAFCMAKIRVAQEKKAFFNTLDAGMDADAMSAFKHQRLAHHNLLMQKEAALLRGVLTAGMPTGEIRAMEEKELGTVTFMLLTTIHGLKREALVQNEPHGMVDVVKSYARMAVLGLR